MDTECIVRRADFHASVGLSVPPRMWIVDQDVSSVLLPKYRWCRFMEDFGACVSYDLTVEAFLFLLWQALKKATWSLYG